MPKQCIVVQYQGMDSKLDDRIQGLATKCGLDWDGTGYALADCGHAKAGTREHFIYGSGKVRISKFIIAVKGLDKGISAHTAAS